MGLQLFGTHLGQGDKKYSFTRKSQVPWESFLCRAFSMKTGMFLA